MVLVFILRPSNGLLRYVFWNVLSRCCVGDILEGPSVGTGRTVRGLQGPERDKNSLNEAGRGGHGGDGMGQEDM